ncbi:MAG: glutathione synthase [Rhodocyclaceae bacterium]|nr:glutathione synthase [Rhodocyclaceae bacterium]
MRDWLFVTDPLAHFKPAKDSSIAIMRAAQAAGHAVWACEVGHLFADGETVLAHATPLTIHPAGDADWRAEGAASVRPVSSFAATLMRKDPPVDAGYHTALQLLALAELDGARVYNRPLAVATHNEKLAILRFPDLIPPTRVTRDAHDIADFLDLHGDIIVKPLDGMGGAGIFRLRAGDHNLGVITETATHHGHRHVMLQRYLPQIAEGDTRVLLIDGEAFPYGLARMPKPGETRGNLAAGGRGEVRPLTPAQRDIATKVGTYCRENGLIFVGLDVIGDRMTEFNVTSPTCMVEIFRDAGLDPAAQLVGTIDRQP